MKIDQLGQPAGVPGQARLDGLSDVKVTLTDTTPGGQSYFELLYVPDDDTTAVSSLASDFTLALDGHKWTFTPNTVTGGPYRLYHRHIAPDGTVYEERHIFGIADTSGVVSIAPGEGSDPGASMATAELPNVIARCERNVPTSRWPLGQPFGWAGTPLSTGGGGGASHKGLPFTTVYVADFSAEPFKVNVLGGGTIVATLPSSPSEGDLVGFLGINGGHLQFAGGTVNQTTPFLNLYTLGLMILQYSALGATWWSQSDPLAFTISNDAGTGGSNAIPYRSKAGEDFPQAALIADESVVGRTAGGNIGSISIASLLQSAAQIGVRNGAGVTLAQGAVLAVDEANPGASGQVVRSDASSGTKVMGVGVLMDASLASTALGTAIYSGVATIDASVQVGSWSRGQPIYVSPSSPGKLTNVKPTTSGQYVALMGYAFSTVQLFVRIEPAVLIP